MVILPSIRRKYMVSRLPKGATVPMSDCVVTLATDSVSYTGSARTVGVTVTWEGATLAVNTDYTLAYANNTSVGPATVTVTGMGQFSGSVTKTFQIIASASSGGWANFDLSDIDGESPVSTAKLYDSGATWASYTSIDTYAIQILPDGRLHFGAQAQGHAYIWGFEEGYDFDIAYFKSTYDSKSPSVADMGCSLLDPSGTFGVYSRYSGNGITKFSLSSEYDLSTRTNGGNVTMATGYGAHIAFSADGTKFFNKKSVDKMLYCRHLTTAYDAAEYSESEVTSLDLNSASGLSGSPVWRGFCFSPDGLAMVVTEGSGTGSVHKFTLSDPWDITTAVLSSSATLAPTGCYLEAVAINDAGTKMILCDGKNRGASGDRIFYEYNLVA